MNKIVIADIIYTNSDETYYVGISRTYQEQYACRTLEETQKKLIEIGFHESHKIERSDGVMVNTWSFGELIFAVWDNEIQPYKGR